MERIVTSVTDLIGNTPLLELKVPECNGRILAKLEMWNPAGSVKDRVALSILEDAENKGILSPGGTVIEATSGNTGIGLCAVAAARGYRCVIVMPDSMSMERQKLMKAYGAQVVLTPGKLGMAGAIEKARELAAATENSFVAEQFNNPENPNVHYRTTGPEIYRDTEGNVDVLVAGIGTGGTISGVGRYLKERDAGITVVGVEPTESPVLTGGAAGQHGIQGIGAGFLPNTLDRKFVDYVMTVSTEDAMEAAKNMALRTGILVGISSGAALCAAAMLSQNPDYAGKTIVVICPDSGERYLSTKLYG